MKRVAMISFHTCPFERLGMYDAGGMNTYIANLSKSLAKLGWEVDIFTKTHKQSHEKPCCKEKGIKVIHIPLLKFDLTKEELLSYTDKFAQEIAEYSKRNKRTYSLMHAHYYLSGIAAIELQKLLQIPFIQTFHTLDKPKQRYGGVHNENRFLAEKTIVNKTDAIVVSTQLEKRDLKRFYDAPARQIHIIPPGVDIKLFRPQDKRISRRLLKLDENKPIILFAGRIDPIKDITTLIKAVDILARQHPEFREQFSVILIGGDIKSRAFWKKPVVQKIQRLIKGKNLDCCVRFVGAVPQAQLPTWFSASDIVVLPSLYESFGLVILEAMATGAATIASKVGGLTSIINDGVNGLFFPSKNANVLAEKIWLLLNDDQLREKLSKNARQKAKLLSWEKTVLKFDHLYRRVGKVRQT